MVCNQEERLQGPAGRWIGRYLEVSTRLQGWLLELQQQLALTPEERGWQEWQDWLGRQQSELGPAARLDPFKKPASAWKTCTCSRW